MRFAVAMATPFTVLLLTCSKAPGNATHASGTCPPMVAVTAGAAPVKGTCGTFTLFMMRKINSPVRCGVVPMPAEP